MYKIFTTDNLDPYYNLSIENWLLHREDLDKQNILFLWRNRPSIIIGRFQNPWLECRLKEMESNNIYYARRPSGGGAVYHDEGNLNFTFISQKEGFSRTEKTDLIIQALLSMGIEAAQGKRYDIYINGKKVSGSASKYTSGKVIHHGTLLIKADLQALGNYLLSSYYQNGAIKSKGIESVRSQVTNLSLIKPDLDHNQFSKALIETLHHRYGEDCEIKNLPIEELCRTEEIETFRKKLMGWDWLYGNTPRFSLDLTIPFENKEYKCFVSIKKGLIDSIDTENRGLESYYLGNPCNILFNS